MNNKIKVGIVGLGMVGEPIRRWFEDVKGYKRGKDLFCYDTDPSKDYDDDVNKADVIFVAVPTPSPKAGAADLSILHGAVSKIANGKTIILKSTIPPGTTEGLQKKFPKKFFIFNPEFLTEAQVWLDFARPDRQILGPTARARKNVREVLALLPLSPFSRPWASDYSKKEVSATEAELSKYASNVYGYLKVIYGNILADIAYGLQSVLGAQVEYQNVREMLSADPRIGPAWLDVNHGKYSGAGGYCFPKDMNAFIAMIEKELIAKLSKNRKIDKGLVNSLRKGATVLKAVRDYNRSLLAWQGISEMEVSTHNKAIKVEHRKPIRGSIGNHD